MTAASETNPPSLSSATVAHMIQIFDSTYRAPTALTRPMFDIEQLSTTLFAMGVEQDVISTCEYRYFWNFKSLFPALYDGSFFGSGVGSRSKGQAYLRGFATFLCGAFVQHLTKEELGRVTDFARSQGLARGEWIRDVILRETGEGPTSDPALAEILGVRLLLVNVLRPVSSGQLLSPEAFDKLLDEISEAKHQLAAKLAAPAGRR